MSHNRDLLSGMPDEILQHILSFLPTRQSVRTSILSRRWRHLWRCVPALHFDFDDRSPAIDAIEFLVTGKKLSHVIDQFLALRDASSSLLRFHLRLHIYDPSQLKDMVSNWISYARSHGVRDMTVTVISWLRTHPRGPPLHICLDLPSVERLYVMNTYSVTSDKLPQQIALGKLKVLTLHSTAAPISDQNLTVLLSSCPALQELTLYHAKYDRDLEIFSTYFFGGYSRTIEIKVPTLRRLSITNEHYFAKPGQIEITCPSLEYFRLSNMARIKHFQGHMPSLFEASIKLTHFSLNVADHFQQIFVSLRGVTKLTFHLEADVDEKRNLQTLLNQIRSCPIFHKLKQFTFKAWLKENYFKEALLEFLLLCPNLVSLELVCASDWIDRISNLANIVEECTQQERIPGLLEHLKTIYLRGINDERIRGDVLKMLSMRASKWESVMVIS